MPYDTGYWLSQELTILTMMASKAAEEPTVDTRHQSSYRQQQQSSTASPTMVRFFAMPASFHMSIPTLSIHVPEYGVSLQNVTHIDSIGGQLRIRQEEIRSWVFQPGYNLPTMSLEEYAAMEMRAAKEAEERSRWVEDGWFVLSD